MEILELTRDHPFFFGTQFHPEFRSRPTARVRRSSAARAVLGDDPHTATTKR